MAAAPPPEADALSPFEKLAHGCRAVAVQLRVAEDPDAVKVAIGVLEEASRALFAVPSIDDAFVKRAAMALCLARGQHPDDTHKHFVGNELKQTPFAEIAERDVRLVLRGMVQQLQARTDRTCRICGCTEDTACGTPSGPCGWVDKDLCSAPACLKKARN